MFGSQIGSDFLLFYVISFKGTSGGFSFHFKEVYEKCIEYIGKFFSEIRETSELWEKVYVLEEVVWLSSEKSLKTRKVSHVCLCSL